MMGSPPCTATLPGNATVAGLSFTISSRAFVGVRVAAAVCALAVAIAALCPTAPSSRSRRTRNPASSTTAMLTFHLFFAASALHPATIFSASAAVKHILLRTVSPWLRRWRPEKSRMLLVLGHFVQHDWPARRDWTRSLGCAPSHRECRILLHYHTELP